LLDWIGSIKITEFKAPNLIGNDRKGIFIGDQIIQNKIIKILEGILSSSFNPANLFMKRTIELILKVELFQNFYFLLHLSTV